MSESNQKTHRLGKVAKELNVGTTTIVEFLNRKGHQVSNDLNQKLLPEMYDLVVKEYDSERKLKEKAEQVKGLHKELKQNLLADLIPLEAPAAPAQELTPHQLRADVVKLPEAPKKPDLAPVPMLEPVIPPVPEAKAPAADVPATGQPEAAKPEQSPQSLPSGPPQPEAAAPSVVSETTPAAFPAEAAEAAEAAETPDTGNKPGLKVLGKVDLSALSKPKHGHQHPAKGQQQQGKGGHKHKPIKPAQSPAVPQLDLFGTAASEPAAAAEAIAEAKATEPAKAAQAAEPAKTAPRQAEPVESPAQTDAEPAEAIKEASAKEASATPLAEAAAPVEAAAHPPDGAQPAQPVETGTPAEPSADAAPSEPAAPLPDAAKAEPEVLRASDHAPQLQGLKVLGKIELPSARGRSEGRGSPTGTSAGTGNASLSEEEKRKRKRKRKRATGMPVNPALSQDNSQGMGSASVGSRPAPGTGSRPGKPAGTAGAPKPGGAGAKPGKAGGPGRKRDEVNKEEVKSNVKTTLAQMGKGANRSRQKLRRQGRDERARRREYEEMDRLAQEAVLNVTEFLTANELATLMEVSVNQVIAKCMMLGRMVSINQRLDREIIELLAEDFGYEVNFMSAEESFREEVEAETEEDTNLKPRPPIVTVMGHVDHGKTSLLDYVRKANVIAGEAGGITQHIGAYSVSLPDDRHITFLDTPGHEAFTAMRARGANVTDVAIIVIAADDQVMPQTKEAINHAQAAGVPMVFAINKVDRPAANPEKIKEQLANMNLLVEDWGGKHQSQDISAKFGQGIDELLEKVLLEAEILDLKANPEKTARGTIIEAQLDKGRGVVATMLVQSGTLRVGDVVLANCYYGRVKAMMDERGQPLKVAGPSVPVQILGLNGVPQAGDKFQVYETDKEARSVATRREQLLREQRQRTSSSRLTLEQVAAQAGNLRELNLIVKADVDGSSEALSDSLIKLSTDEVKVNVVMKGVGQITESDVLLASASNAIIVGFNVRPSVGARKLIQQEEVDVRNYSIIYNAINEIKDALEGLLAPEMKEDIVGIAEIRDLFKISKVGTIAGCKVVEGLMKRTEPIRIVRDGIVVFEGKIDSLRRLKDDVREVQEGFECGIGVENFNDLRVGDLIEQFTIIEVKRALA